MPRRTVYVESLHDGVAVWRPVEAEPETDDIVLLPNAAPDDERCAFAPASRVGCEWRDLGDGPVLVVAGLVP